MDLIQTRINETKYDHYPLNRLLPIFSVFNIFKQNYEKETEKKCFLNNHKYLKLREGYFAMFACKAFDEIEGREHLMVFSDEEKGDVAFCSYREDEKIDYFQCDVKEYHLNDPNSFNGFLKQILLKPKINKNHYGLIIGIHRDVFLDMQASNLLDEIQKKLSRGIFLVSNIDEDSNSPCVSRVVYINNNYQFDKQVQIGNNGINEVLIFQTVINSI